MYSECTRSEKVLIRLSLDKSAVDRYFKDIRRVTDNDFVIGEDDTLRVNYEFAIHYFGEVEAKLKSINYILNDESVIRNIKVDELRYGQSLLVSIIRQIDELIEKINE